MIRARKLLGGGSHLSRCATLFLGTLLILSHWPARADIVGSSASLAETVRVDAAHFQGRAGKVADHGGALTQSIPLWVPSNRRGLQPQLTLSYSSDRRTRASWVGAGWNLSLPSIRRVTRFGTPPVKLNRPTANPDIPESVCLPPVNALSVFAHYIYDDTARSDRPIFASTQGDLVETAVTPSYREYRYRVLHDESRFRYYQGPHNPSYWEVVRVDGTTEHYGRLPDNAPDREQSTGGAIQTELGTFEWGLVRITDPYSNTLDVRYHPVHAPKLETRPAPVVTPAWYAELHDDTKTCYSRYRMCLLSTCTVDDRCVPPESECTAPGSPEPALPMRYCGMNRAALERAHQLRRCGSGLTEALDRVPQISTQPNPEGRPPCDRRMVELADQILATMQERTDDTFGFCTGFYHECKQRLAGQPQGHSGQCSQTCDAAGGIKHGACESAPLVGVPLQGQTLVDEILASTDPQLTATERQDLADFAADLNARHGPAAASALHLTDDASALDIPELQLTLATTGNVLWSTIYRALAQPHEPQPELNPVRIEYGANPAAQRPHSFRVDFTTSADRPDKGIDFLRGAQKRDALLTSIGMYQGDRLLRTLSLNYLRSADSNRPLLVSVVEKGGNGTALPATSFTYSSNYTAPLPLTGPFSAQLKGSPLWQLTTSANLFGVTAFEESWAQGSGSPIDFQNTEGQSLADCIGGGAAPSECYANFQGGPWGYQLRDLNGDGLSDLFYCNLKGGAISHCHVDWNRTITATEGGTVSGLSLGGRLATGALGYTPTVASGLPNASISEVLDLNGDGIADGLSLEDKSARFKRTSASQRPTGRFDVYWGKANQSGVPQGWSHASGLPMQTLPGYPACDEKPPGPERYPERWWMSAYALQMLDLNADGDQDVVLTRGTILGKGVSLPRVWIRELPTGGNQVSFRHDFATDLTQTNAFSPTLGEYSTYPGHESDFTGSLKSIIDANSIELPGLGIHGVIAPNSINCANGLPIRDSRAEDKILFLDLNGDGLTDLIHGAGWVRPQHASPTPTTVFGGESFAPLLSGGNVYLNQGYRFLRFNDHALGSRYSNPPHELQVDPTAETRRALGYLCHNNRYCSGDPENRRHYPLSSARWADLNGDGLVDLVFSLFSGTHHDRAVFLNTGTGFRKADEWKGHLPPVPFAVESPCLGGQPLPIGKALGGPVTRLGQAWRDLFGTHQGAADCFHTQGTTLADVDGDGRVDLLGLGNPNQPAPLYLGRAEIPDLLVRVDSAGGAWTEVTYDSSARASTTTSWFHHANGEIQKGVVPMLPRQVVTRVVVSPGAGEPPRITRFDYEDGRRDVREKEDLGFRVVRRRVCLKDTSGPDPVDCPTDQRVETTTYEQIDTLDRVAMRGFVRERKVEAPGVETEVETHQYQLQPLPAWVAQGTQDGRYQTIVRPKQTLHQRQLVGADGSRTVATETEYDGEGYPWRTSIRANGALQSTVERTYAHSPVKLLAGLVRSEVTRDADGTVVRSTRNCYDDDNGPGCSATPFKGALTYTESLRIGAAPDCAPGSADRSTVTTTWNELGMASSFLRSGYGGAPTSVTSLAYDTDTGQWPVQTTLAVGALPLTTQDEYDTGLGLRVRRTDPAGVAQTWAYDDLGRLLTRQITDSAGSLQDVERWSYAWHESPLKTTHEQRLADRWIPRVQYRSGAGQDLQQLLFDGTHQSWVVERQQQYDRLGRTRASALPGTLLSSRLLKFGSPARLAGC